MDTINTDEEENYENHCECGGELSTGYLGDEVVSKCPDCGSVSMK